MYREREMFLQDEKDYNEVKKFLQSLNLKMPKDLDYTLGIYDGNTLIGTGSLGGKVIKGVGISPEYQGEGISSIIITSLIKKAIESNIDNIFIYTKPESEAMFVELGFKKIGEALPFAVLLEWGGYLESYISRLKKISKNKPSMASCIVMNCNPFTLGHRYLIEKAAGESEFLYILVVEEDRSLFPFKTRLSLIKEGVKDIENIEVIPGGDYIISWTTFPSYFTKEADLAVAQASLDLNLFSTCIAPALKVTRRFVGEEPYSRVTSIYNNAMKKLLPKSGIEVVEIPRLEIDGSPVSASRVREEMSQGNIEKIRDLVPPSTYKYLISPEGEILIEKAKKIED